MRFAEIFKTELFSKYRQKAGCYINEIYDIMCERRIVICVCIGIFTLVRFTALTYRFTNILLMLFLKDRKVYAKRENERLPEADAEKLDERLRRGI